MRILFILGIFSLLIINPIFGDDGKLTIPEDTEIITTKSGLKYSILKAGKPDGLRPNDGDKVKVHYSGWLLDGTLFDSSVKRGTPSTFGVNQVIRGWTEGLKLMTVGSKYKFTIPSELGYGPTGSPPKIPKNADLIFEVELLEVIQGPKMPEYNEPNKEAQKKTETGLVYEILKAGEGECPKEGEMIQIKFAVWTDEKELVVCTEMMPQGDAKYPLGRANLAVLNQGPLLMKPGAHFRFEVPPNLAFAEKGDGRKVKPNAHTVWELRLVKIMKPLPIPEFSLSPADKLITTKSGLKYEVIKEGEGNAPRMGQGVVVHYAGWLNTGKLFDASFQRGEPQEFRLGQVIQGWNEGLALMKEGAIYKLTIPANLGYGARGAPPNIPPNAELIFYVELIKVK